VQGGHVEDLGAVGGRASRDLLEEVQLVPGHVQLFVQQLAGDDPAEGRNGCLV
jgi:hypothetical protein